VDRQAENSALRFHLEKEIEDASGKLDEQVKKCQEQDDRIKQLREELASNRKLLADNQKKDDEIIASGKAEVEALKALVSALEKQLKEIHQEGKAQMEQLEARAAVLGRELEGAALEMKEKLSEVCKAHDKELANMNAANAVLKAHLEKTRADSEASSEKEKEKAEKDSQGPLLGKVLRVVSEAAGQATYDFQGKCLSHNLSTRNVVLELDKSRLVMQAEHCIEAEAFHKKSFFARLNSVTRAQKAQMLENSGCLRGLMEGPQKVLLVTAKASTWLEDQSLEFGLELLT
jgi:hypothetical protein